MSYAPAITERTFTYSAFPRRSPAHDRHTFACSNCEVDIGENIRAVMVVVNSDIPELNLPLAWPIPGYAVLGGLIVTTAISFFWKRIVGLFLVIQ